MSSTAQLHPTALSRMLNTQNSLLHFCTYLQLSRTCIAKMFVRSFTTEREFAFSTRTYYENNLINMYGRCGSLADARKVFDDMREADVFSWNLMIAAYQRQGYPHEAVTIFQKMQQKAVQPDHFTFATILPACGKLGGLEQGMKVHQSIIQSGFLYDVVVLNALIDMYAKCGSIDKARELFEKMPQKNVLSWNTMIAGYMQNGVLDEALRFWKEMPRRDVVSWNAMVAGYAQNGFVDKALETLKEMQFAGLKPNSTSFASILPACAKMGTLEQGVDIHHIIIESGDYLDVVVASALIDMYAKCGSIWKAREVFEKMPRRDVVSWNAMIAGYTKNGVVDEALGLFKEMPQRDVVSWNAMIAGYAANGFVEKVLKTFKQMQLGGVEPNSTTFASMLPACAKMGALEQGMVLHQRIIEGGFLSDITVVNTLIGMYAKCGSIKKACQLFEKMSQRDVVSWNAMIAAYGQNGLVEKALETLKQMQLAGVKPNSTTFASILPACAKIGTMEHGMDFHQKIIKGGFLSDLAVVNSMIVMYARCGSVQKAQKLFDKMSQQNVISWNAMIAGYAMQGYGRNALKLYEQMKHSESYPDHVSFICVLFACSHAGLVDEGCKHFNDMRYSHCIMPTMDHYVCMIDLLGRAGYLDEALNFFIKMPTKPTAVVWMCLLGACRSNKNISLGVFAATFLFKLDPKNDAPYVLLSDIYAEVGRWPDVQKVRRVMKDRGIKKIPGCSWIEVHKMVHVFCVGDRSHPQAQGIYAKLEKLSWEMKAAGYFPDSRHVLNDVEEEEKEMFLCQHSEKLAIAFGLLNMSPGTTIRVVKNLRVCIDCHTAAKFIARIVSREIVVRDASRFHHFKQGQCSCGDYW